jgi:hypothetical protein
MKIEGGPVRKAGQAGNRAIHGGDYVTVVLRLTMSPCLVPPYARGLEGQGKGKRIYEWDNFFFRLPYIETVRLTFVIVERVGRGGYPPRELLPVHKPP